MANAADFSEATPEELGGADSMYLPEIGIAVVASDPSQSSALELAAQDVSSGVITEPERVVYAISPSKTI